MLCLANLVIFRKKKKQKRVHRYHNIFNHLDTHLTGDKTEEDNTNRPRAGSEGARIMK